MSSAWVANMFERFGDLLAKEFHGQGFVRLDSVVDSLPVERHGAWEWTFCQVGDLNRYVAISILPYEAANYKSSPVFNVQLVVGADYRDSFVRRVGDDFLLSEEQLRILPKAFLEGITTAMKHAQALTKGDLTDHYLERPDTRNTSR